MTRDEWIALAERCETAKGADREIDAALLAVTSDFRHVHDSIYEMRNWYYSLDGDDTNPAFPSPSGSLDAITAVAGPVSFPGMPNTKWIAFALPPAHKAH